MHPHSTSSEIVYAKPFPNVLKKRSLNPNCPQFEYGYTRVSGDYDIDPYIKNIFDIGI